METGRSLRFLWVNRNIVGFGRWSVLWWLWENGRRRMRRRVDWVGAVFLSFAFLANLTIYVLVGLGVYWLIRWVL